MAITTYDELKASIANWLNRDDLADAIPDFISLAEAGINRSMKHWRMEERATATLATQYEALPARWISPIRLSLLGSPAYQLEPVGQAEMTALRGEDNTAGRPRYYCLTQGELEFYPTPNSDYDLEMVYYEKPAALSDSNASNWVLEHFPDIYLYGALIHSAPYLADDQRAMAWATLYQTALDVAIADGENAKFGGSGLRMKVRAY